jgi:hypothetical protein
MAILSAGGRSGLSPIFPGCDAPAAWLRGASKGGYECKRGSNSEGRAGRLRARARHMEIAGKDRDACYSQPGQEQASYHIGAGQRRVFRPDFDRGIRLAEFIHTKLFRPRVDRHNTVGKPESLLRAHVARRPCGGALRQSCRLRRSAPTKRDQTDRVEARVIRRAPP